MPSSFGFGPGLRVVPSCSPVLLLELVPGQRWGLVQGGLGVGGDPCSFTFPLPWPFCSLRKERGPLDLSVPYLALGLALACLFPFLWNQEWNEHWLGNLDSKTARAISSPLVFLLRKQKKTKQYLLNLVYDCPKYGRPCPLSETSAPLLSNPPQNLPILGITAFIW